MELTTKDLQKLDKIHEFLHGLASEISEIQESLEGERYNEASYSLGKLSKENDYFIEKLGEFDETPECEDKK